MEADGAPNRDQTKEKGGDRQTRHIADTEQAL